jgi:hypothetical protein
MLMETDKSYIRELIIKHIYTNSIEEQKAAIRRALDDKLGVASQAHPAPRTPSRSKSLAEVTAYRKAHGIPVPELRNVRGVQTLVMFK